MAIFQAPVRFFLGANTPQGFVGYAHELYNAEDGWQAYLIKSGPGTGKSSLMRRLYEQMAARGIEAEVICCSSDPSSLDGLVFPDLKKCILDATAPHVVEPICWGAVEQLVPLSVCADETVLHPHAADILEVTRENQALHTRCRKYLHAAAALLRENRRIGAAALDEQKIHRLAQRTATREFGNKRDGAGRLTHRFLSAVTPQGLVVLYQTLQSMCPRIYVVEDEHGAAARMFLADIAGLAQKAGVDGIVCPCPLAPEDGPEHLLFPSVGVGFTTSNAFHTVDFPVYRRIHATRFADAEQLRARRQIHSFNRRAARDLLTQAQALSAEAKAVHDKMEEYSAKAMDWEAVRAMGDAVIQRFTEAAKQGESILRTR